MSRTGFQRFDGQFGTTLTYGLGGIAIAFFYLAATKHPAWAIGSLPFVYAVYWRWRRIHSSQPRRFQHHFLHVFVQMLAMEMNRAKAEGDEVSSGRAAGYALQVLRPEISEVDHILLMANALKSIKSDEDRNQIAVLVLATPNSGVSTIAEARRSLDAYMEKNQKAVEARWIAAQHVSSIWGERARLELLRDVVLRRLSE